MMKKMQSLLRTLVIMLGLAMIASFVLVGCGNDAEPFEDIDTDIENALEDANDSLDEMID